MKKVFHLLFFWSLLNFHNWTKSWSRFIPPNVENREKLAVKLQIITPMLNKDRHHWPRGHILKSLASKPQVLENCPALGSRTALFFEPLKFCWKAPETSQKICEDLFLFFSSGNRLKKKFWRTFSPEKNVWRPFFWDCLKKFFENLFFLENTCACVLGPWPREGLSLALASKFFCVLGLGQ